MTGRGRVVIGEILDTLEVNDPRARVSRSDLRRVNRAMGARRILLHALGPSLGRRSAGTPRWLELGAGDGTLMLAVARGLANRLPAVDLTLLDQADLVDAPTQNAFARLGWSVHTRVLDVNDWATAGQEPLWDLIVVNLFLHHFPDPALSALLTASAARCRQLIACEPRRGWLALLGSHLIGALAVNDVTRHDAILSVRAGFRDRELSGLWPRESGSWQLQERAAGLFSHLFCATRTGPG